MHTHGINGLKGRGQSLDQLHNRSRCCIPPSLKAIVTVYSPIELIGTKSCTCMHVSYANKNRHVHESGNFRGVSPLSIP